MNIKCRIILIKFYAVEPLLKDTSIVRTPPYYGQFTWSESDRN